MNSSNHQRFSTIAKKFFKQFTILSRSLLSKILSSYANRDKLGASIAMGIGAMTDFGPLIANPKTALLGGAAQLGVFITLFGVAVLNLVPGIEYNMFEAAAIAIIGGADGP